MNKLLIGYGIGALAVQVLCALLGVSDVGALAGIVIYSTACVLIELQKLQSRPAEER